MPDLDVQVRSLERASSDLQAALRGLARIHAFTRSAACFFPAISRMGRLEGIDLEVHGCDISAAVVALASGGSHGAQITRFWPERFLLSWSRDPPSACVLLCAVELCSLHLQEGWNSDPIGANALFADGGGVSSSRSTGWQLIASSSTVLPGIEDLMGWIIEDHGCSMVLSAQVPSRIAAYLCSWTSAGCGAQPATASRWKRLCSRGRSASDGGSHHLGYPAARLRGWGRPRGLPCLEDRSSPHPLRLAGTPITGHARAPGTPGPLDQSLQRLHDPGGAAQHRLEAEAVLLHRSKIFQWSKADFLAASPSIQAFILPHLQGAAGLEAHLRLAFLPYDWSLNQRTCS